MIFDKEQLAIDGTPLGDLLESAGIHGVQTPDINTLSQLASSSKQLAVNWKSHQTSQHLLLVLRVARAEIAEAACVAADVNGSSNEEIRALLTKQRLIDNLIRYVTSSQSLFESGGRFGWR